MEVTYNTVAIPMTVSDLQEHASIAGLLKCDFAYSCTTVDEVSTDF